MPVLQLTKKDIIESIESEFSGDVKTGLIAVVQIVRFAPAYFADLLYKSMKGIGTDESLLNRVVASRCEVRLLIRYQILGCRQGAEIF